jgi:hypothetical protein
MVEASEEVRDEINQFKDAFILMCDKLGKSVVCFERNYKTSHLQFQLVPIPKENAKALRSVLMSEADQYGLEFCFVSCFFQSNIRVFSLKMASLLLTTLKKDLHTFILSFPMARACFYTAHQSIISI